MRVQVNYTLHLILNCILIFFIDYLDDLILSGLALYRATQNEIYLNQSLEIYKTTVGISSHIEPLDWDNKVFIES